MAARIITVPNLLTVLRMGLIPVLVILLFYQRFGWGLAVFIAAGFTDMFDGLLARRFNQTSPLGRILDPIADKLLLVTTFVVLSMPSIVAPGSMPEHPRHLPVPFWVTAAVISRDVFIVVGAAAINIVTGFRGFRPSWLGKVSTVVQISGVFLILTAANWPPLRGSLPTVYIVVCAFTVFSGVHYIFFAARLLNEDRQVREALREDG